VTRKPVVAVAMGLAVVASLAQAPPSRAPVFPSISDRVLVDVVVTDKKDEPVLDLTAADFELFEDGKRQEIRSFAAYGAAATRARQQSESGAASPASIPFVLAASVLLIDETHMSPMETARLGPLLTDVLKGFQERRGQLLLLAPASKLSIVGRLPEDTAALATAVSGIRGQRFPQITTFPMTDREALDIELGDTLTKKRLIDRFTLLNPHLGTQMEALVMQRMAEIANEVRTRRADTFGAMRTALGWLAGQPGRHALVLVTSGFAHDPADRHFKSVVTESLQANAPIHLLDVSAQAATDKFQGIEYGHALGPDTRVPRLDAYAGAVGAELVAGETGGLRIHGNEVARGLKRIFDTTRTYYVLSYEPVSGRKPGFRKIKVEVKSKGWKVLARRGYFDDAKSGGTKTPPI